MSAKKKGPVQVQLLVTNLHNPSHMEWTPDGRLLVSEHTKGQVKDVTRALIQGGDMSEIEPFAYGLDGPASIAPLQDGRILVAETWSGCIKDISGGGDMRKAQPFAVGLSMPYSIVEIVRDRGSNIYVSEGFGPHRGQITEVTDGGDRDNFRAYVTGLPSVPGEAGLTPLRSWPHRWEEFAAAGCVKDWETPGPSRTHYIAVGPLGQIIDVTDGGGDYLDLVEQGRLVAWGLHRLGGMILNRLDERIYAVEPKNGNVIAVDPTVPTNCQFEPPVVRGLNMPTCPRFSDDGQTLFVCDSGVGGVWRVNDFLC